MFGKTFRFIGAAALAAGLMTAGSASAEAPTDADWAAKTLSQFSEADLAISSPAAKAYLEKINPKGISACDVPAENRPAAFDKLCSWALNYDEADFDILIGIKNDKIVSFVSAYTPEKDDIWLCEDTKQDIPESDLKTCNLRSADEKTRKEWSDSWTGFLEAIN